VSNTTIAPLSRRTQRRALPSNDNIGLVQYDLKVTTSDSLDRHPPRLSATRKPRCSGVRSRAKILFNRLLCLDYPPGGYSGSETKRSMPRAALTA
jgi:hypothetical protein